MPKITNKRKDYIRQLVYFKRKLGENVDKINSSSYTHY